MKQLKLKSLKSNLALIIVLVVIAGFPFYISIPSLFKLMQGPSPLEEVDFDGDIEGLYVSGTLPFIYDWYCETAEGVKTLSREYIIDAGQYYYMGMRVMATDMAPAEKLLNASYDYIEGLDDGTDVANAQYEITGTITKMPEDSIELYHDYFGWDSLTIEEQEMFLPYYLEVNKAGGIDTTGAIVMFIIGFVFLCVAIYIFIATMLGKYQRNIKKYISNSASPDMAKEKIENFLNSTPEVKKLRYNRDFICGAANGVTAFGETSKLIWIYLHTTTHRQNFITIGKTYALMLYFADGSSQAAEVKSEEDAREHLQHLESFCPQAIIGYSDDLARMLRNDRNGFLNLRYNAAQAADSTFSNFSL